MINAIVAQMTLTSNGFNPQTVDSDGYPTVRVRVRARVRAKVRVLYLNHR